MTIPIVVVDDEEFDRYIARRVVKAAGIDSNVIEYKSGDDFLAVVKDSGRRNSEIGHAPPPMLVLLDINMPRTNGFEVLEEIKKSIEEDEGSASCMIILMFSSSTHAADKTEAFSYDFVKDYIVKPLTVDRVKEVIGKFYD